MKEDTRIKVNPPEGLLLLWPSQQSRIRGCFFSPLLTVEAYPLEFKLL